MTIDVLLVDDHTIFRSGLKRLFLDEPDLRVADEARNGNEALDKVRARPFHIVVLDINMEGRSGLEVLAAIRRVAGGGQYLSPQAAPGVQMQLGGRDERPAHQRLTVREHQIMLMIVKGKSLTEIGEEMLISVKTVSTHRTNILTKLALASN